jgi:hypothetical protein
MYIPVSSVMEASALKTRAQVAVADAKRKSNLVTSRLLVSLSRPALKNVEIERFSSGFLSHVFNK